MAKDGIQIDIDKSVLDNLQKQFTILGTTMDDAGPKAIFKVLMKIKTEAQNYLRGRGHIVSSRLRNSIHVQMMNKKGTGNNPDTYSDRSGQTYSSELKTVVLKNKFEGAVGTNVEYASAIEFGFAPRTITAKDGGFLSFLPQAKGQAWFTSKTRSTLRTYYRDRSGANTLERQRVFVKSVRHPGFAGDSYLYRAAKSVDITQSVADDLRNSIKFGKFQTQKNNKIGAAMTNED